VYPEGCSLVRAHGPLAIGNPAGISFFDQYAVLVVRWLVERKLTDTSARLRKAREELAILNEQSDFFEEEAEDARIRSVISETPGATGHHNEAQRHVTAMTKARLSVLHLIADLQRQQDELLDKLSSSS
jgi:hypothetical protein